MSSDTLRVVAIGAVGLVLYSKLRTQATYTAKKTQAAVAKRTDAAVIGSTVAAGLASLFGSSSGQAAVGRAASTVGGWFTPSTASTPAMDWGVGTGWGDDSTAGAVQDSGPDDNFW